MAFSVSHKCLLLAEILQTSPLALSLILVVRFKKVVNFCI
nr:MAG TPA: hypothetical protein [Bacteriophage sp.]